MRKNKEKTEDKEEKINMYTHKSCRKEIVCG
jgi:hypothetical protein